MTSQTETTDFDVNLVDLLRKFSEEKKAHGETILQLLYSQAQAQTAKAEAAKAQELVAEITLKLDQAREEIKGLRAQAKELETARAKIESLEDRMVKARTFLTEFDVETNSEPIDQTQELKAKIESLEFQVAQMKVVDQFQVQAQELKAAQEKITEFEAQMAQSEKQALHRKAQAEELEGAQAQVKDLESKMAQAQEEIRTLRTQTGAQAQNLQEAQAKICSLEAQVPEPPAPAPAIMCERYTVNREYFNQYFCIVQNGIRLYFQRMGGCEVFTKFIPKKDATLELVPGYWFKLVHRVSVSDGQDWVTIGHIGSKNNEILIGSLVWSWVTKRTPARINADGNEEYQLAIRVEL